MTLTRPGAAQTRAHDDDAVLWAASHLADLPEVVRLVDSEVSTDIDSQGRSVRNAFVVTVRLEEPRRFMIHLRAGASLLDLETARRVIYRARTFGLVDRVGGDLLWDRTDCGWRWLGAIVQDEAKPHREIIRACTDPACVEEWHSWTGAEQNEPCTLEAQQPAEWCSVHAFRFGSTGMWEASVGTYGDPAEGPRGVREVQELAAVFTQMQVECDRLNNQISGVAA